MKGTTSRESGMLISTGLERGLQSFSVYDSLTRLIKIYESSPTVSSGGPAFLTEYKYDGDTSVLIATKESVVVWDSAWSFDNIDPYNLP